MKVLICFLTIVISFLNADNTPKKVLIEIVANEFLFDVKSFSTYDSVLQLDYDYVVIDKSDHSTIRETSRLIKVEFPSDTTFSIKTYLIENSVPRIKGNMGHFKKNMLQNTDQFQEFIILCYKKTWGEFDKR